MKETNFLRTAIISEKVLDGIPLLTTSTVSCMIDEQEPEGKGEVL
jgi:hypothetical protein